jgi:leucyl aminopeptidase (aminopeptidase T)
MLDSVNGVIAYRQGFGFPSMGYGFDVDKWFDQGLRFVFEKGRVVRVETDGDQKQLDQEWAKQTGDKDRLGEFVLGCNPLLRAVPGSTFQPYYCFGEGKLRLTLGENLESGGSNRSSMHRWLMFIDANISADGKPIVANGHLAVREL